MQCHVLGALREVMFKLRSGKRGTVINVSGGGDRKDFTKEVVLTASVARGFNWATIYNYMNGFLPLFEELASY